MKKLLSGLLMLAILCLGTLALAEEKTTLAQPTDFAVDTITGDFTFTANDANAGYYFVRVYPVVDGEETVEYVSSSRRINGGKTGEMRGSIDTSGIGWGTYHIKLITFAASGTNYAAPAPVILDAFYGVGGTLERPEILAMADGNEVEFVVDWYSVSDYYAYQYLPHIQFSIYADADYTQLVLSDTVNLNDLRAIMDTHPAGGYMWGYTTTPDHVYFEGRESDYGFLHNAYYYTLEAGTYYAIAQAISEDETKIASSQVSDVVSFTLTNEAPNGEYVATTTSLWQDAPIMGMPTAAAGGAEGRIDTAASQTTTSYVE